MAAPKIDFSGMSPEERLRLIEVLWDSLDPDQAAPMTPELAAELERRSTEAGNDSTAGKPWEEIRADLEDRLRK